METIIRTATETDLPGILEIYNDAILNNTAIYEYKPFTLQKIEQWYADKIAQNFPVIIAQSNNTVAGFATYGPFRTRPAYKYAIEHSVYVHADFRRQGIAKRLLQYLINMAQSKKIHTIVGGIDASNIVSINFHKQFGFTEVAYFKEVGYKFGKWLDLVFLQLILPSTFEPDEN